MLGLIFTGALQAHALPYPDPTHPPLDQSDVGPGMPAGTFEGSFMASKGFTVPAGGTTISFNYNFLTDELGAFEAPVPVVNDYFGAGLLPAAGGDPLEVYYIADVLTSSFSLIHGGTGATGPHGSFFTWETGVLSGSVDISPTYQGQEAVLAFAVFDLEDPFVDSGVLIDNIVGLPNGDFTGGLLGTGGFIGQDKDGWDLYGGNVHLLPDGSLSGVDTTGFSGNYAYLSTGPEAMTAVPEPGPLLLLGSGLSGLVVYRMRLKG